MDLPGLRCRADCRSLSPRKRRGVLLPVLSPRARCALGLAASRRRWDSAHLSSPQAAELAYALIAVACAGFVGVLLAGRHGGISTRVVVGWSVALIALACVGPPLFARSVRLCRLLPPLGLPPRKPLRPDPLRGTARPLLPLQPLDPSPLSLWSGFTKISAALVWAFRSAAATVTAFKALAGLCWIATVVLAARLGRRQGPAQACFAAAVIGLNPLVITRIVAGGHSDALVALAVIAALTAWYEARPLLVTVS